MIQENNYNMPPSNEEVLVIKEKKRKGCGPYVSGVVSGFLFTVLLLVGATVFLLFHVSLKTVEGTFGVEVPFIRGNYETMPLKDLIKELTGKVDEIKSYSLETLSKDKNWIDLPQTIPGTNIQLQDVYDSEITIKGKTDKVKNFAVYNDIYLNFDEFVDEFIDAIYKTNTVDDLLKTLNVDIDQDLNYPAFTEKLYSVNGTTQKSFRNLKIKEALDILPDYFSSDKLTMQRLIESIGFDVSDYKFASDPEFLEQTINTVTDYVKTISLEKFIDTKASLSDCENLTDKVLYLLRNATYEDFTSDDISAQIKTRLIESGHENYTLGELIGVDEQSSNAVKYAGTIKLVDIIGGDVEQSIINSLTKKLDENNVERDVTIGELFNFTDEDSISSMIKEVKMSDLIGENAQPDKAIRNALCNPENTLGKLLNYTSDDGIVGMIKGVTLNSLLGENADPEKAIKDALCEENNTLQKLLNVDGSETGIAKYISKIKLKDLLSDTADVSQTIKTALSKDVIDGTEVDVTIGDIFEINSLSASRVVQKLAAIPMGDLLGVNKDEDNQPIKPEDTLDNFVNNLTLTEIFDADTITNSKILKSLSTYYDEDLRVYVDTPIKKIPDRINDLTLKEVITINENSSQILKSLQGSKINNLANAVDNLTLAQALGNAPQNGIISLITPESYNSVKIKDLTTIGASDLKPLTIENMYNANLISNVEYDSVADKYYIVWGTNQQREIDKNLTIEAIFEAYAEYQEYLENHS